MATRASWSPATDSSCASHSALNSPTANTSRNVALAASPGPVTARPLELGRRRQRRGPGPGPWPRGPWPRGLLPRGLLHRGPRSGRRPAGPGRPPVEDLVDRRPDPAVLVDHPAQHQEERGNRPAVTADPEDGGTDLLVGIRRQGYPG